MLKQKHYAAGDFLRQWNKTKSYLFLSLDITPRVKLQIQGTIQKTM